MHEQAAHGGLGNAAIYLADLQEDVLRLVTGRGLDAGADAGEEAAELRIDSTPAGTAFMNLEPVRGDAAGRGSGGHPC